MDWTLALQRNHDILLRIVAGLFTLARVEVGGAVEVMPRYKRLAILHVLWPAESAYRRVILIAVFVLKVTAPVMAERVARSGQGQRKSNGVRCGAMGFRLIDPRKRFGFQRRKTAPGPGPRLTMIGSGNPVYDRRDLYAHLNKPEPSADDEINAARLCDRLNALRTALDDLPAQALRMVTLQARMKRRAERYGKPNLAPMRPAWPPGHRQRQRHEIDEVLAECHQLALRALHAPPDTS